MDHRQTLHQAIVDKVFVTGADTYIHAPDFTYQNWLFDFRAALLQPTVLDSYAELFIDTFQTQYPFQVGGLEVAAIPLITAIVMKSKARKLLINGFFIRKNRKKTGLLKMIEGTLENLPIILVDDLINSGGSFQKQVEIIIKLQVNNPHLDKLSLLGIHTLLRFREAEAYTYFSKRNIPVQSFFDLNDFPQLNLSNLPSVSLTLPEPPQEVLWHWRGGNPALEHVVPKAGLVQQGNKLFTITDDGYVVCLHTTDGSLQWRYKITQSKIRRGQFSTPLLHHDTLYFGAHDGNVYALEAQTGKRRWVSFEGDWVGGSPELNEKANLLYICVETGLFKKHTTLYAFNILDGSVAWSYRLPGATTARPLLCKKSNTLVVATHTGSLVFLNASTGTFLSEETIAPYEIYAAPVLDKNEEYLLITCLGSDNNTTDGSAVFMYAFKTKTITKLFTGLSFGNFGGSILFKDTLIVPSLDKHIYALSLPDGKVLWKIDTQSRIFSQPYLADTKEGSRLFVGTNGGELFEIEPNSGTILTHTYFVERITNAPLYDPHDAVLFVLTYTNEIYAVKRM